MDKITSALASRGARVHIICRNRDGLPCEEKVSDSILIHRLAAAYNGWTRNLVNFPAFFSPFWIRTIIDVARKGLIDLIIVRDLPLAAAAYLAGLYTGKPVILDMAENYPALIQSMWTFRGPKPFDYIVRNPALLRLLEKAVLPRLDGILVVSPYSGQRVSVLCRNKQRVWVVGNTPSVEAASSTGHSAALQSIRRSSSLILIYVGFVEAHRGLDVPIRALSSLVRRVPDALLVIVGKGSHESRLREMAATFGIERNVLFTGWLPHDQIREYIDIADIGLIPHYVTEHTDTTLPNKIFDYMACGKPVVVTQSKALTDIVVSADCGLVYTDSSPEEFCEAVEKLSDSNLRKRLGSNGQKAVIEEYNWERDVDRLWSAINETYHSTVQH